MKTFALIPARGGSKGIPRKNILPIAGRPLIAWTIEAALRSRLLDAVVVSTDDEEIAEVSRKAGAQVPFMRPPELALDSTPGIDPVFHALAELPDFDSVLLLQPTSPLRQTADIDGCLEMARGERLPSIVSVCEPDAHPCWTYRLAADETLVPFIEGVAAARRQDLPPAYAVNGALYFAQRAWLLHHRRLVTAETRGFIMPRERSVDIDTRLDWRFAEMLLKELQ